jgi:DNA-binding NarL/FixJ family response regulator
VSDDAISLLLVDDHVSFRELLALRLARESDFAGVAEAGSLAEARGIVAQGTVDVAVVDLDLPDGNGVELIRDLRALKQEAKVLVLTASGDRQEHGVAVAAGASGVLNKAVESAEIVSAIRRLGAGDVLLTPHEAVELFRLADQRREAELAALRLRDRLTPRELDLLHLLAEGLDDAAIADRLFVSPKTVRNQMVGLLDKLGVDSRLQALVFAVHVGIVAIG